MRIESASWKPDLEVDSRSGPERGGKREVSPRWRDGGARPGAARALVAVVAAVLVTVSACSGSTPPAPSDTALPTTLPTTPPTTTLPTTTLPTTPPTTTLPTTTLPTTTLPTTTEPTTTAPTTTARFALAGVTNVHEVAQLTGPDSMNHTGRWHVAGQDLGSMFQAFGKTWFVFGDTFGTRDPGQEGGGGGDWRSNTLAYSTDTDPTDGITFDGYVSDKSGWAKELIPARRIDGDEITVIPTYGFEANSAMYLYYMSVQHWGDAGAWDTNYSGLARSTDHGQTWTKLPSPRWPGDSNFIQVSVARIGPDLYFWGVTHGRFGGVQLMKVPEVDVEKQGAYQYFSGTGADGQPTWSADMAKAKTVVDGTVGELSVVRNPYLNSWLMTYTDGGGNGTEIRSAATPWGPWSDPHTLVSASAVPGVYAPYMLPEYTTNGGRTIYFTLSVWNPYNVFWYRADLVKK